MWHAGDLHFYMRHSFCPFHAAAPPAPSPAPSPAAANEAGMQNDDQGTSQALGVDSQTGTTSSSRSSSHATASMAEPSESKTKKGAAAARFGQAGNGLSHTCFNRGPSVRAVPAELSNKGAKHAQRGGGPASTALHLRALSRQDPSMAEPAPGSYASSTTSGTSADDLNELRRRSQSGGGASTSGQSTSSGWHPHDPEHLIVNGLGGAFLHPTHVFSPSRFVSGEFNPPRLLLTLLITHVPRHTPHPSPLPYPCFMSVSPKTPAYPSLPLRCLTELTLFGLIHMVKANAWRTQHASASCLALLITAGVSCL